jgi:hypothetical protein
MLKHIISTLALLGTLFCAQAQATVILQLDPANGSVSGTPGATVGWGFTLSNDADYLVVTSASFTAPLSIGIFTDYISQNFFVVGPPPETSPVSQAFDSTLITGIGSFAIDLNALAGGVVNNPIVLTYDLFSVSPNDLAFDPDTDTISVGNIVTAGASVEVVPEPATVFLFLAGLFGLSAWKISPKILRKQVVSCSSTA